MSIRNQAFANTLLFEDPETHEELFPSAMENDAGDLIIRVKNRDGTRCWKHTIRTEEEIPWHKKIF